MALVVPHWSPQAPLHALQLDWLVRGGIEVAVLRLDLIDPLISGNKWFKLAPYLHQAATQGLRGLISLGGPHSNHLHALAAAGKRFGFASVGLLRGEPQDTPTIADLQAFGMQLHWLGYGGYRDRHRADFWLSWRERYPELLPVAEGGGGLAGARGCAPLVQMVREQLASLGWADYHGWWLAAGTGTTMAGLVLAEEAGHTVHGAMAVPGNHGVAEQVRDLLAQAGHENGGYQLIDASRGGFGKVDAPLRGFIHDTEQACGLPMEPVYTAKALLALRTRVEAGYFPRGTRLIFVHTGGLQGRRASLGL
ncbi:1-aminocyclopropane-1-carboxylate deaminase [Pseudomonas sp. LS44]|uniref:1-aminocyclopropane-1-carboxylate deaminase/D-cysteine desulfhydrase n=1 Tax=Pseudomonas sp. LS44 TaxID=1357074 RepID=UPI00215A8E4E|nr:1-aminocyclopropane-1-carboxylate deaminase [Pseudomonas sp. LS44]UVE16470.1 1-aminocyclopropane-1-carboxylate deaminase [Pseudomonas sp. LS44]